jgi:thiol-disulfide isomerase/thioredoxin
MPMRNVVLALVVAASAAGAGLVAYRSMVGDDLSTNAAIELGRLRLPDPQGKDQNFEQWRNKVLIVNFWATWCEPCREEVPDLLKIQAKYAAKNVQIVGIAVDSAVKVRQFADEYRIVYPLLVGGMEVMDLARRLGNGAGGLPYTIVLDASGRVVATRLGRISEAQLEAAVRLATS